MTTEEKRGKYAIALMHACETVWNRDASEETVLKAEEGLKVIIGKYMPYFRNEEQAELEVEAAYSKIEEAFSEAAPKAMTELCAAVQRECGISEALAAGLLLPSACRSIGDYYRHNSEDASLYVSLFTLNRAIASGGKTVTDFWKQLRFISDIMVLRAPENITAEQILKCVEAVDRDALSDLPVVADDITLKTLFTRAFDYETWAAFQKNTKNNRKYYDKYLEQFIKENGREPEAEDIVKMPSRVNWHKKLLFVEDLQKVVLETLLLTADFLNENGLRFYLAEGTLLGAVRHHGFIPWDDDVDIIMPRDDYEKLVQLDREGKIPPELNFDSLENNPNHWVLGAKMQLTRPTDFIQAKVTSLSKYDGPYVDIFPLDYWKNNFPSKKRLRSIKNVGRARRALFIKTGYSRRMKKKGKLSPKRMLFLIGSPLVKNEWIESFAIRNMTREFNKKHKYMVNLCSYYPYQKEVFPIAAYGEPVMMEFEGHLLPVPSAYDYMLKTIYGFKYDTLPPASVVNSRKHTFQRRSEVESAASEK